MLIYSIQRTKKIMLTKKISLVKKTFFKEFYLFIRQKTSRIYPSKNRHEG